MKRPTIRTARILLPQALLLLHASTAAAFEVKVHAREVAPGEPIRVVVAGVDAAPTGSFRGAPVAFSRGEAGWVGWAAVPLDAKAGPVALEVRSGGATERKELRITAKKFPEQRLKVEEKYVSPSKAQQERIAREKKRLDAIYARRTDAPAPSDPFVRPVPGEPTSAFGLRRLFNGQPRAPHAGLDLKAATGTPVRNAGAGLVVLADDLYFAGKTVIVDHGAGLFTIYAHLSRIDVKEGDEVAAGNVVGLSGATGRVTGPHLHWGARVGETIFDPRALLDARLFGR
ncbi:MAG TPA: M23 family metallopeptidase [Candidatus Polarisedimenticolaceae bacterium]